jgi:urea transport system permease protein
MTYALLLAFFRNEMGFGGNNGLTDFKDILGFDLQADDPRGAVRRLGHRAGDGLHVCRHRHLRASARCWSACATRKAGPASSATGSSTYKLFVFVVSAMMAGVAGALYVPQVGIINPGEFAPANSIEIVIWDGGRRARHAGRRRSSAPSWSMAARATSPGLPGILAVRARRAVRAVTLFLPKGIVGLVTDGFAGRAPASEADRIEETLQPKRRERRNDDTRLTNSLLYLDGVSVAFDGFKAINEPVADRRAWRDARHHRPERRRQDDDDGHHHRQDPAGRG